MRALLTCCLFFVATQGLSVAEEPVAKESSVYELRVYTCVPGRLPALHGRFAEEMALFAKHGMTNIAYFEPLTEPKDTMIYIVKHDSREAAKASWAGFRSDPDWVVLRDTSEKEGKIVSEVKSTFMVATDYSPKDSLLDSTKVFELRTYVTNAGKLEALNSRFRDHTDRIFKKYGMHATGYWTPTDEPQSANTLIYVLQHDSKEAAGDSWKSFISDVEWKKAAEESEKNGKLLAERPQSVYMKLTEFSPKAE